MAKTLVSERVSPDLVSINYHRCKRITARKAAHCAHSGKAILSGDAVYRPIDNSRQRTLRYLATEIEALEERKGKPDGTVLHPANCTAHDR